MVSRHVPTFSLGEFVLSHDGRAGAGPDLKESFPRSAREKWMHRNRMHATGSGQRIGGSRLVHGWTCCRCGCTSLAAYRDAKQPTLLKPTQQVLFQALAFGVQSIGKRALQHAHNLCPVKKRTFASHPCKLPLAYFARF
mmetsp:Transcript_7940/g.49033  ORF Transcript_7940/g.49033 Transcript_7940/m.49033 type:complete len:139 (-) Transcript_7940:672-1088(-)